MTFWPWFIFVLIAGACVGSFLNVVIYRLPAGESIVTPPSRCPRCGYQLAWYDNVPVLAWLWLGGRCRKCRTPISAQYPLIEALTALLFGGLFLVYYVSGLRPQWQAAGLEQTWPVLVVHLGLIAGLLASTVIDARLYIIPLQVPWTVTVLALVVLPISAVFYPPVPEVWPMVESYGVGLAIGGAIGLAIAVTLLWMKVLPQSFEEPEAAADASPLASGTHPAQAIVPRAPAPANDQESIEAFLAHPHPRREVFKEALFIAFPLIGAALGMILASGRLQGLPAWTEVLAGVVCGYLLGGGVIWITRILGTLAFGKEAMGLGDVHLLAAIGAVLGPKDPMPIFFIAPFMGLLYVLIAMGVSRLVKGQVRIIPYGPYLAGATLAVMLYREPLLALFGL